MVQKLPGLRAGPPLLRTPALLLRQAVPFLRYPERLRCRLLQRLPQILFLQQRRLLRRQTFRKAQQQKAEVRVRKMEEILLLVREAVRLRRPLDLLWKSRQKKPVLRWWDLERPCLRRLHLLR